MFFKSLKKNYTALPRGLKALLYISLLLTVLCYLASALLRVYGIANGCLLALLPAIEGLFTIAPAMAAAGTCAVVLCDLIYKDKGLDKRNQR